MRKGFERRRDLIVSLAKEIPGFEVNVPDGAFYLFPRINSYFGKTDGKRTINNSTDFAMYLLEVGHVATVGGDAFGEPDGFRMSYATSDDNFIACLWDKDPLYYTVREDYIFDYRVKPESPAIGAGDPALTLPDAAVDAYGLTRSTTAPTLGAYVYQPPVE